MIGDFLGKDAGGGVKTYHQSRGAEEGAGQVRKNSVVGEEGNQKEPRKVRMITPTKSGKREETGTTVQVKPDRRRGKDQRGTRKC